MKIQVWSDQNVWTLVAVIETNWNRTMHSPSPQPYVSWSIHSRCSFRSILSPCSVCGRNSGHQANLLQRLVEQDHATRRNIWIANNQNNSQISNASFIMMNFPFHFAYPFPSGARSWIDRSPHNAGTGGSKIRPFGNWAKAKHTTELKHITATARFIFNSIYLFPTFWNLHPFKIGKE